MAWIELHQTLPQNKKTIRLMSILRIDTPQAVGHLCMIWLWALDNAQDGDLSAFHNSEIAYIAGWKKKPDDFIEALISAGFLTDEKAIHDWYDYAGKLIDKRKIDAERKRMVRGQSKKSEGQSKGSPEDIQQTTAESSEDGAGNRTVPYRTVPNRTIYSGGGDDACARESENADFEDYEDGDVENLVESASQHYQTLKDIKCLDPEVKARFYKTADLLFTQYFQKKAQEYDYTILYRLVRWVHINTDNKIYNPTVEMTEDDIELLTNAFEAAAMADKKNLAYIRGVIKRYRERGIQSASDFWGYEIKRSGDTRSSEMREADRPRKTERGLSYDRLPL